MECVAAFDKAHSGEKLRKGYFCGGIHFQGSRMGSQEVFDTYCEFPFLLIVTVAPCCVLWAGARACI